MDNRLFKVVHPDTLEEWTESELEEYAKNKTYLACDALAGIFVDEDGDIHLADMCGYDAHLPHDKFQLEWNFDSYMFSMVVHNGHAWRRVS